MLETLIWMAALCGGANTAIAQNVEFTTAPQPVIIVVQAPVTTPPAWCQPLSLHGHVLGEPVATLPNYTANQWRRGRQGRQTARTVVAMNCAGWRIVGKCLPTIPFRADHGNPISTDTTVSNTVVLGRATVAQTVASGR